MNMIRILTPLTVSLLAITAFATPHGTAGARAGARTSAQSLQSPSDPEFSPLQDLASSIDDLGTSNYPSIYGGVEINSGELDVYIVAGDDQAFLNAVAATDSAGLPYTIKYSTTSYATQAAISQWIGDNRALLQNEGINPGWWGSYPQAAAVRIALQTPTDAELAELQSAANKALQAAPTVTPDTYLTVASAVMNAQVPSPGLIVVYPALLGSGGASNGYNDTSPFYGADQIKYTLNNTATCTSNFSYNGTINPSNHWTFTAGHCSSDQTGHDWYTCATHDSSGNCTTNVGTVTKAYSDSEDFESVGTSNAGYVWNDSDGSLWSVNGYITAEYGDHVTVDGEANGTHYNNFVTQGGHDTCVTYGSYFACNAIVISTGTDNYCPPGDSGGPVLERESDGYHIKAVGMILGWRNTQTGDDCLAQQVYQIRSDANVALIWGN